MTRELATALRKTALAALVLLLAVDAGLLVWHLLHGAGGSAAATRWLATSRWSVERDRGIPEVWGYLQLILAAACLTLAARRRREPVLYAWAATYAVVFFDDWMMVHERGARVLLRLIGSPAEIMGVRAQDVGELVVWAGLAVLPLILVAILHLRSGPEARGVSLALGFLMASLVFFGVVLDQVHSFFFDGIASLGALEDGGELAVISVVAALAIGLVRETTARPGAPAKDRDDVASEPGSGSPTVEQQVSAPSHRS